MRVLILGGGGMLGHKLAQTFRDPFETWVTVRGPADALARFELCDPAKIVPDVDVTRFETVAAAVARVRPQAVINCVGIIKQLAGAQDPVLSLTVNSLLPHLLQRLVVESGARLIHISTDCVFSGRKGMYTEHDASDAEDLYGRTKFLGETRDAGALTHPDLDHRPRAGDDERRWSSGFCRGRANASAATRSAVYSGFTTLAMARSSAPSSWITLDSRACGRCRPTPIAKYDLLLMIRHAYGLDVDIVPDDRVWIDRSLDSSRFRALTAFVPPSWPDDDSRHGRRPDTLRGLARLPAAREREVTMFSSKTLLITGGTGTFGNAVLQRFLDTDIARSAIFSRDEKKQEDMRLAYNSPKLRFYIGDVRDYDSVAPRARRASTTCSTRRR